MKGIKPQGKPWTPAGRVHRTLPAVFRGKPRGFKPLLAASLGNASVYACISLAILAR